MRFLQIIFAVFLLSLISANDRPGGAPLEVTWLVGVGPDRPMYEKLMARFHELHPDIRIRPIWVPGSQYQVKVKTLIAAGKPPDIFWSGDVWVAYELPFLADLTDLVERDKAELDLDDFYPELLANCRYDGRRATARRSPRWFRPDRPKAHPGPCRTTGRGSA